MFQKGSFPRYQKQFLIFLGVIVFPPKQPVGRNNSKPEKGCGKNCWKSVKLQQIFKNPFFGGFCLRCPNPGAMPCSATEACDCTERCCWDRFFQVHFGGTFEITWRIGPHLGYVLSKGARITRLNLLRGRKLIMVLKHLQVMG